MADPYQDPNSPYYDEDDERQGPSLRERAGDEARGRAQDRLEREAKDRIRERFGNKSAPEGTPSGPSLETPVRPTGVPSAPAAPGATTAGAEGLGAAAPGATGAGAATTGAGGATAGAAGTGAVGGAAATGAGATGAAAGTGAAAAGTGAAVAGTEAAVVGAGAAAGAATAGTATVAAVAAVAAIEGAKIAKKHIPELLILGATVILIPLMLIFLAGSLKPIAEVTQIGNKYNSNLEQVVDERSVGIFSTFVMQNSKGATATGNQAVQGGKLKELFTVLKDNQFEKMLKDNYGLEFTAGPSRGSVNINRYGQNLGTASNTTEAGNILRLHFKDLRNLLDTQIRAWPWAQHLSIARPAATNYKIPQLNIPGAKGATEPKQIIDVVKYQFSTIWKPSLQSLGNIVTCFTQGTGCNESGRSLSPVAKQQLQDDPDSSVQKAAETSYNQNLENIAENNNYRSSRLDDRTKARLEQQSNTASLPILGWLDSVTALYKVAHNPDYAQLITKKREQEAGALWTWWWSAKDQIQAGDVSSQAGAVITRNFDQIESSQVHNYIVYDDTGQGKAPTDDEKINSTAANPLATTYNSWVNRNPLFNTLLLPIVVIWDAVRDTPALTAIINFARHSSLVQLSSHYLHNLIQDTAVGNFIDTSFGLSSKVMLPVCDSATSGALFGNCLGMGAQVSANESCKLFGCGNLTVAEMQELKQASQKQQAAKLAAAPWQDRLFNPAVPNSLVNIAAIRSPISTQAFQNVSSTIHTLTSAIGMIPKTIGQLWTQPAHAAGSDPSAISGVAANKGIPHTTLVTTGIAPEVQQDGGSCPERPEGQVNMCKADDKTIDAWLGRYKGYPATAGNSTPVDGTVGAPVNYHGLWDKYDAGTLPDNLLCNPPGYPPRIRILCGAPLASFVAMNEAFKKDHGGRAITLSGIYRTAQEQKDGYAQNPRNFVPYREHELPPEHLWGTAIDFHVGDFQEGSENHNWLKANAPKFGFYWPTWASSGRGGSFGGTVEAWHWGYYGVGNWNPRTDRPNDWNF